MPQERIRLSRAIGQGVFAGSHVGRRQVAGAAVGAVDDAASGFYYVDVSVGTPARTFTLQLSHSLTTTWIGAAGCATCKGISGYDPAQSTSGVTTTTDLQTISYYDVFSVSGTFSTETFRIGDLQATGQTFLQVTNVTPTVAAATNGFSDGVLGLGLDDSNIHKSIVASLYAANNVGGPIFGLWLNGSASGGTVAAGAGGEITIGFADQAQYTGQLTYVPLHSNVPGFMHPVWAVQTQGLTIGANGAPILPPSSPIAMIDVWENVIGLDEGSFAAVLAAMQASVAFTQNQNTGLYTVPCAQASTLATLPT
ncbi:hypothetical protein HK101_000921, partial [Irineochytrium annulatum]